ncbi:MAG TPA: DUF4150 domain-containing protein [Planctomycetota bacterium]|nr:DUF4150 domain-containing protein [Planctomycetota bacterium]
MANTVFANMMGLFHKGSDGKSIGFPDVCLSPPPPPAGPIPIPYPNIAQASDLADGSQTVKVDGNPTALQDSSSVSTSSGDEAGTQGGNVVTHKTKGKGYFQLWSFDVKFEGKNVDRQGDMMGQNCASAPPGTCAPYPLVNLAVTAAENPTASKKCKKKYKGKRDRHGSPTAAQRRKVQGKKCWFCHKTTKPMIADHQPPCVVQYYAGNCNKTKAEQRKWARDPASVKPHCKRCSPRQGGLLSGYSQTLGAAHGH